MKQIHQKSNTLFLLGIMVLLLLFALCGCNNQQNAVTQGYDAKDNIYVTTSNDMYGVLNAEGKWIIEPQKNQLSTLRDSITKAPKYILATQIIPGEKDPEYDMWNNQYLTALYDTNGNLLFDYREGYYDTPFQHYLIYTNNGKSEIIDMNTKETVMEDFPSALIAQDMLVITDYQKITCAFYDENLELIKSFPDHSYSHSIKNQDKTYFEVCSKEGKRGLLDENLDLILPCNYLWVSSVNDKFVIAQTTEDHNVVIDLTTGETVLDTEEDISYYDGTIQITSDYNDGNWKYIFTNVQEENQSQVYKNVMTIDVNNNSIPLAFLCDQENGGMLLLDSSGRQIMTLPKQSWVYTNGNILIVENYSEGNPSAQLFTLDGQVIPTEKKYSYGRPFFTTNAAQEKTYMEARYENQQNQWVVDILDENGNIVVENIQPYTFSYFEYDYCDGYRILGRKGFYQGMMDMKGNWIYKESIFNSLANEF